jgi:transcriptional regulator PpsR
MKFRDIIPLTAPQASIGALATEAAASLVESAGDVALVVDERGRVIDVTFAGEDFSSEGAAKWIGRAWADIVTIESRPKIADMIASAAAGEAGRWRQVNHPAKGSDIPVRYRATAIGGGRIVAVGRDLREMAAVQQRLLQAQQSLERDYLRLRHAESRYRMLFDLGREPVLIVDAETRRIKESNPAANTLAKVKDGALVNRPFSNLIDAKDLEAAIAYLGSATVADDVPPVTVRLAGGKTQVSLSATAFRQDRATFFLIRLIDSDVGAGGAATSARLLDVIDRMPDAFVLADGALNIVAANHAFVELTQAVSLARIKGTPIGDWLGRAGIDVGLIVDQLRENGAVRNAATIVRGAAGAVEQVEVSAVSAPGLEGDCFGFSIRSVGRRMRDLPPAERDLPRSVEQLTELVGRMSLKDIVRESTDLIERLCIEAALQYTSDNRASAAEILGVSRQSLYSKLHRHGLGNLVGDEE